MSNVNLGDQEILYDFRQPATSAGFNRLLRHLIKPGVYKGGVVNIVTGTTVQILPLEAFLNTQLGADNNLGCHVKTKLPFTISIPQTTPGVDEYLYITLNWLNTIENWVDFLHRPVDSSPVTNEVIVARLSYTAGNVTDITYIDKTWGFIDVDDNNNIVIENSLKIIDSGTPDAPGVGAALIYKKPGNTNLWIRSENGPERLLLGTGGGSGFSPLVAGFAESPFQLITATEFTVDGTLNDFNDLIDPATDADEAPTFDFYTFSAPQQKVKTVDLIGRNFPALAGPIDRAHIALRWAQDLGKQDPISKVRVSRNGGLTFDDVPNMRQVTLRESNERALASQTSFDTSTAINFTSQLQLGQGFQVSYNAVVYSVDLSLARVGTPSGRVRVSLRGDDGGAPSLTDILATSNYLNINDLLTTFDSYRFTFFSQVYLKTAVDYYIVLELENPNHYDFASTTREVQWRADSTAPVYTQGQAYIGTGSSFTGVAGTDQVFTVYGKQVLAEPVSDIAQGDVAWENSKNYLRNDLLISYPETNGDTDVQLNSTSQQLIGQRIRLSRNFVINQIQVRLKRTGTPGGQMSLSIYSDTAGLPSSLYASAIHNYNSDSISTTEEYVTFNFDGLELPKNTDFWIVLDGIAGYTFSGGAFIAFRADASAATYLAGTGISAVFNGTTWSTSAATTAIFQVLGAYADSLIGASFDAVHDTVNQIDIDDSSARERLGQKFTLGSRRVPAYAELILARVGTPGGSAYVQICEDSAGQPGAVLLESTSVLIDELDTSASEVRFHFESRVRLSKNTVYWLVLRTADSYTYADGVDEIQWFRDPTTPVHAAGGSSVYASGAWTPSTGVQQYTIFGYEAELLLEIYGRTLASQLAGFAAWYLFQDSYVAEDPSTARVQLDSTMKSTGAVPTSPVSSSAGKGMLLAVLGNHILVGGQDFSEGDSVAYFDPADLSAFDEVTFVKIRQGLSFSSPTLELQDRLRTLPEPILVENDVETIQFDSTGGASAVAVELPDGTVLSGPAGARVSFNSSKNRYGGLGLDTGSETASTLYYIYAVKRPGTVRDLGYVLSSNSPELGGPVGYRYWALLGKAYNDASSDLYLFNGLSYLERTGITNASTNTNVALWANLISSIGDDVSYQASATLGDSFLLNRSGSYTVAVSANASAALVLELRIGALDNLVDDAKTKMADGENAAGQASVSYSAWLPKGTTIFVYRTPGSLVSTNRNRISIIRMS